MIYCFKNAITRQTIICLVSFSLSSYRLDKMIVSHRLRFLLSCNSMIKSMTSLHNFIQANRQYFLGEFRQRKKRKREKKRNLTVPKPPKSYTLNLCKNDDIKTEYKFYFDCWTEKRYAKLPIESFGEGVFIAIIRWQSTDEKKGSNNNVISNFIDNLILISNLFNVYKPINTSLLWERENITVWDISDS